MYTLHAPFVRISIQIHSIPYVNGVRVEKKQQKAANEIGGAW